MDGRTFRYHDNHEFFRSATAVESGGSSPLAQTRTVARKRPKIAGQPSAPPSQQSAPSFLYNVRIVCQ